MLREALLAELNDRSEPTMRNVKRLCRGATCKIAIECRMPPSHGRDWVLAWRGHDTGYITDTAAAQSAAEHTGRRLAEVHGVGMWRTGK